MIPELAAEVSAYYKSIDKAKSDLKETQDAHSQQLAESNADRQILLEDKNNLAKEKAEWEHNKVALSSDIVNLSNEVKSLTKEIAISNSRINAAKEELIELDKKKLNLQDETKTLLTLVNNIEQTKLDLKALLENKGQIEIELSTAITDANVKLKEASTNLETLKIETAEMILQRDKVQYQLKSYTDQLYTNMNDYQVVRSRIEGVWEKTFPELNLPLAM